MKMILFDSFYRIGKHHTVCQDYASHGLREEDFPNCFAPGSYIAIADGCSSAPKSDLGARLLVETAKNYQLDSSLLAFKENVLKHVETTICSLDLNPECLDSSLLLARLENDKIKLFVSGDGNWIIEKNDNSIEWNSVSFSGNAPYYLSYENSSLGRRLDYKHSFGGVKTITKSLIKDSKIVEYDQESYDVNISSSTQYQEYFEYSVDEIKSISLASDGLSSFYQMIEKETAWIQQEYPAFSVVIEMMNHFSGNHFLNRKYTKMIKNFEKQKIYHGDDLSMATMRFIDI